MNAKQIGLAVVLADFAAYTGYVVYRHGYLEFVRVGLSNLVAIQLSLDLVIALSLVTVWMWRDARERGVSFLPYALLTATLGSIGPLLYLVRRAGSEAPVATSSARLAAQARHA